MSKLACGHLKTHLPLLSFITLPPLVAPGSRLPPGAWCSFFAELSEGLVGSRCSVRKWCVSPSPRASETRLLRTCLPFAWALVSWRSEPSRSGLSLTSSRWSGRRCRWSSVTSGLAWSWSERPAPAPEATRWVQESLLLSMGVCVVPASPWEVSPQPEPRCAPCLPGPPRGFGSALGGVLGPQGRHHEGLAAEPQCLRRCWWVLSDGRLVALSTSVGIPVWWECPVAWVWLESHQLV